MSRRVDAETFVVHPEKSAICELCGKKAELRPYGPKGENICFSCGMKDEATTLERFKSRIGGVKTFLLTPEARAVMIGRARSELGVRKRTVANPRRTR